MSHKILIVDDEPNIVLSLEFLMRQAGYQVRTANDGVAALVAVAEDCPDLILLDAMMPHKNGFEVCQEIRANADLSHVKIVMLTAKGREVDREKGMAMGADDYITKPFSTRELIARIKAVLRRSGDDERLQVAELQLDTASHRVTVNGQTLDIGPTEYRLLHFFMSHPERVYSRSQLLDQVWGSNVYVEERTVDVHIRRLRRVLETFGYDRFVQTVRGAGYRFSEKE